MSRKAVLSRVAVIAAGLAVCGFVAAASPQSAAAGPDAIIFQDNMENGINGWTTSLEAQGGAACPAAPEWHQSMNPGDAHSPTHAWTNNPYTAAGTGAGSAEYCVNYLTSPSIVTPLGEPQLTLTFWEKHHTEGGEPSPGVFVCNAPGGTPPCDFGVVQISNDNGANFTSLPSNDFPTRYEGATLADFTYKPVTLGLGPTHFTPGNTIRIRFAFHSDALVASPPFLGWFIDDVVLQTGPPTGVGLASFSGSATGKGVALRWRASSEVDIFGFNVWRFGNGKSAKVNRTLIAARGQARAANYSLVDRLARPGVAYTYRLQVVTKAGKRVFRASTTVQVR